MTKPNKPDSGIEQTCIRLLANREHSRRELLNKLSSKGYDADDAVQVIDDMAERNWQSDLRFAEAYVRQRIAKGYGPLRINFELQQRGINDFDIDPVLHTDYDGWLELLQQVYLKKYDKLTRLSKAEWLRRLRFMQQRGFNTETINVLYRKLNISLATDQTGDKNRKYSYNKANGMEQSAP